MMPRQTGLSVSYENVDISADLQEHLIGWTYTDNMSGQADDFQITLEDIDQLWSGEWMPEEGAALEIAVTKQNWTTEGDADVLPLGRFEIDEVEVNSPPSTVVIRALSIPESNSLRGEQKDRAWEETHLSVVAGDIASGAGMELFYDTDDDPAYDRIEQAGETDLMFLMRICEEAGLCLKVTGTQIVIFDESKYEMADTIADIVKSETDIKSRKGRKSLTGVYGSCRVEYTDPSTGETIRYTFTPGIVPNTKRVLVVNQRVTSIQEAERLAKKKLRAANRESVTYSLTMTADLRFAAGLTVNLSGFGKFDGKYVITQMMLSGQKNGLDTTLALRRVLEGY